MYQYWYVGASSILTDVSWTIDGNRAYYARAPQPQTRRLIEAITVTRVELVLIHPFQEGNGRLFRFLTDAMVVRAGLEALNYSCSEVNKDDYIRAIHQGIAINHEPMKRCQRLAVRQSSKQARRPT
jgi:cell filamentation protein